MSRKQVELDTVLVKVASRCNIDCKYCYVYHLGDDSWSRMDKLMSIETIDAISSSFAELVLEQEKGFSVVLHGGEPLLLGYTRLRYFLSKLRAALPKNFPISIQTNGILITEKILDLCSEFHTSIAVSIDGPEHIHNKSRIDHRGKGTFQDVVNGIDKLQAHTDSEFLFAGLLAVIDPKTESSEIYKFFKRLNPPSIDFLFKDGNHTNLPPGKLSIESTEYGAWMVSLLDAYLDDSDPIPIRVLDDMLKVLLGGDVSKEDIGVTNFGIVIIDTDGSITKNDTLKSAFNGADRFTNTWRIQEHHLSRLLRSSEFRKYHEMQRPTSANCIKCPELNICGGGMTVHRWRKDNGYDNPSVFCADQLHLIQHMRKRLKCFGLSE